VLCRIWKPGSCKSGSRLTALPTASPTPCCCSNIRIPTPSAEAASAPTCCGARPSARRAGECAARGIELHWVDRGGDITYHGPGQLVGYPILKLGTPDAANGRLPQTDYVGYMRRLEEMLIRVLLRFGLVAGQLNGITGVFVQPDVASRCAHCPPAARLAPSKIAQIGVKVDARGVSQHGFALNVAPEMAYFEGIIGCGLREHAPISMADLLGAPPDPAAVRAAAVREFAQILEREVIA